MSQHSKRKKQRLLHADAQELAQLMQLLDEVAVKEWSYRYLDRKGIAHLRTMYEYVMKNFPEAHDTYYRNIVLLAQLKQANINPEEVNVTHFISEKTGRKTTQISRKSKHTANP